MASDDDEIAKARANIEELMKLTGQYSSISQLPLPRGLYEHFKGGRYILIDTGYLESDPEVEMVFYASCANGKRWTRPLKEWNEPVKWPDEMYRPRYLHVSREEH